MNILITGGGGFIGNEAALELKADGHEVSILDNNPNEFRWFLAEEAGIIRIRANVADINSESAFNKHEKYDAIIHCAAQTAATTGYVNPREDFISNALGTFEVCEFARKNDAEIIFTSSNKVYGENPNVSLNESTTRYDYLTSMEGINEDFSIDHTAHSPYGCSKLAGDMYVQDYHHSYGLKTNVYRMSCIYGASQTGTEDQGWIYHIVNQILNNREVRIFGDGKQVRDILYVDDLVNLMKCTLMGGNRSGVYNVGGGRYNTISLLELIERIKSGYENYSFHPWRTADQRVYISDIEKVTEEYNWKPEISVIDGLNRLSTKLKFMRDAVRIK